MDKIEENNNKKQTEKDKSFLTRSDNLHSKRLFNPVSECEKCYLEQYKLYTEFSNKLSDRRQRNNDFFLAINTGLVAFLGVSSKTIEDNIGLVILISFAGILMCLFPWRELIKSYENLIKKKFIIICKIESKLPLALFTVEKNYSENKLKSFIPSSKIYIKVPWIFILLYIGIILNALILINFINF